MSDTAYDDSGQIVPITEFEYPKELPAFEESDPEATQLSEVETDRLLRVCDQVFRWVWQNGTTNPRGLQIRAVVACAVFVKELRPFTMSDVARGYGMHKQSIDRGVQSFKRTFPYIRTPHMRMSSNKTMTRWPPSVQAMDRAARLTDYVKRFPSTNWPTEHLEGLQATLLPVVQRLWPKQFNSTCL